jgi:hypothetical protein
MNVVQLLDSIQKRPGMYLGKRDLDLLQSYINGFYTCEVLNKMVDEKDEQFQNDFYHWLQKKYELASCNSWRDLVKQLSEKNGKDEMDLFFAVFNEFKTEKLSI